MKPRRVWESNAGTPSSFLITVSSLCRGWTAREGSVDGGRRVRDALSPIPATA